MNTEERIPDKRKYLLENFGRAIQEGWIEVYYQPIIRSSSGRVCGEEALVRWDDPILGILNPAEFIPILESVNLIDRLDLYVLEQVIKKLELLKEKGIYTVIHSVNFSQIDFFSVDIVDEVKKRVEVSNIPPSLIAIDVTENAVGSRNEMVLSKLEQFHQLGFKIWMDNYGGGDLAPIMLQQVHFDLVKIDMGLVQRLRENKAARVVATELSKLAMGLGINVAAEGVEDSDTVMFLNEIGCSNLQGFYFCKPISLAELLTRYENGTQIGFENPDEMEYYDTIGKTSLYDLSFANNNEGEVTDYFDTLPMAIFQVDEEEIRLIRCNGNFSKFFYANYTGISGSVSFKFKDAENHVGFSALKAMKRCAKEGKREIIDERTMAGRTIQLFLQKLTDNPVTKTSAVAAVVLSVKDRPNTGDDLTYNYIANALAEDYIRLFFVNLESNEYVEYAADGKNRDLKVAKSGPDFFEAALKRNLEFVYKEDKKRFKNDFSKEKVIKDINKYGKYNITYRAMLNGVPTYVNLKAIRVRTDNYHILVGVTDVDGQMRQQEAYERIKEEHLAYNRITALAGNFISIYTVNPENNHYSLFKTTERFQKIDLESEGDDFFEETRKNCLQVVYKEDLEYFLDVFTKENIMDTIEKNGFFSITYRLCLEPEVPTYISLRGTIIEELDGPMLLMGLVNVDDEIKREIKLESSLSAAEEKAKRDALTGVKNKNAYTATEEEYNKHISDGSAGDFAIVVCDLNGLKEVNDTHGHQMGDLYIQEGCKIICNIFSHSPVFRVGGDEFAVLVRGLDYENIDKLMKSMDDINAKNKKEGKVTIAVGICKSDGKMLMGEIFDEADAKMYLNKKHMKMAK